MSKIPFEEVVQFHGHVCPGLAMGYRMALAGLDALSEQKADDEEIVRSTISDYLSDSGHHVVEVRDGAEAIIAINNLDFDLR